MSANNKNQRDNTTQDTVLLNQETTGNALAPVVVNAGTYEAVNATKQAGADQFGTSKGLGLADDCNAMRILKVAYAVHGIRNKDLCRAEIMREIPKIPGWEGRNVTLAQQQVIADIVITLGDLYLFSADLNNNNRFDNFAKNLISGKTYLISNLTIHPVLGCLFMGLVSCGWALDRFLAGSNRISLIHNPAALTGMVVHSSEEAKAFLIAFSQHFGVASTFVNGDLVGEARYAKAAGVINDTINRSNIETDASLDPQVLTFVEAFLKVTVSGLTKADLPELFPTRATTAPTTTAATTTNTANAATPAANQNAGRNNHNNNNNGNANRGNNQGNGNQGGNRRGRSNSNHNNNNNRGGNHGRQGRNNSRRGSNNGLSNNQMRAIQNSGLGNLSPAEIAQFGFELQNFQANASMPSLLGEDGMTAPSNSANRSSMGSTYNNSSSRSSSRGGYNNNGGNYRRRN